MKYLSVCSGIEAASVAWAPLGFGAVGYSEIDRFPSELLKHRYPNITNYGDMKSYKEWDIEPGSVDIMVGGTPCQSFSIAGMRKGLADERGGLALVYLQMALYLRPTWLVWENVPGVLLADRGRSFGTFLGAMAELGYGFSYRVLDAQYFGVPQRRRRVFVVGHLGDWRRAVAVLFERASLSRHTQESNKSRQGYTGAAEQCVAGTVSSKWAKGSGGPSGDECQNLIAIYENHANDSRITEVNVCPTLSSRMGTGGNNIPLTAQTLTAPWHKSGGTCAGSNHGMINPIINDTCSSVRKLTPTECERLQGFPDGYTDIPWRGQLHSPDSLRYKAIGNSMAVPVMKWIGQRIGLVSNMISKGVFDLE